MEILLRNMLPDGLGGGKAAVRLDALDAFGKRLPSGHQHRGGTHGNAAEVDGKTEIPTVCPPGPGQAVLPFQQAEADVVSLAVSLGALLHIEYVTVVTVPEGGDQAEIPGPTGPPAVEGDDQPPGVFASDQVAHQLQSVEGTDGDGFGGHLGKGLGGGIPAGKESLVLFSAGDVEILPIGRELPVHGQTGQGVGRAAGKGRRSGAHTRRGGKHLSAQPVFCSIHHRFPAFRNDVGPVYSRTGGNDERIR